MDPFSNREEYRSLVNGRDLARFRVTFKETDLAIAARAADRRTAERAVKKVRAMIEAEIARRPEFLSSLVPLGPRGDEPEPVLSMLEAGRIAGAGPMAAVAGVVAEYVGRILLKESPEVIVENGGDIFLAGNRERVVAIAAGDSPLSDRFGIRVVPGNGVGICTSSGTYGHSLSFGRSDAAVVAARDTALADAVATVLGNRCTGQEALGEAVEWAAALPGVDGAVAVLGDRIAAAGNLELTLLNNAGAGDND